MYVCAPSACLVPVGARRECHLDLESQTVVSYCVVLGVQPGSSARISTVLSHQAISLTSWRFICEVFPLRQSLTLCSSGLVLNLQQSSCLNLLSTGAADRRYHAPLGLETFWWEFTYIISPPPASPKWTLCYFIQKSDFFCTQCRCERTLTSLSHLKRARGFLNLRKWHGFPHYEYY